MNCIALAWKYGQILGFPCHKSLFTSKFNEGRIAHIEGGRLGVPLLGSRIPTLGKRPPCVSPRLPKRVTWGNVSPDVPPSRVRGVQGVCAPYPGGRVPVEHCICWGIVEQQLDSLWAIIASPGHCSTCQKKASPDVFLLYICALTPVIIKWLNCFHFSYCSGCLLNSFKFFVV